MKISRKYLRYAFLLVAVLVIAGVAIGIFSRRQSKGEVRRVLVLHSWQDEGEDGKPYRDLMDKEFRNNGINADVRHIYLNFLHRTALKIHTEDSKQWDTLLTKWNPEVIIASDVQASLFVLHDKYKESKLFAYWREKPVIFSGITDVDFIYTKNFPMMTGFECQLNVAKNCEMINEITGRRDVTIELDPEYFTDSLSLMLVERNIRENASIIYNKNFHIDPLISDDSLKAMYPGKFLLNIVSAYTPEFNAYYGKAGTGKDCLQRIMQSAKDHPQLQVKYDTYSNQIIECSKRPQFTTIRAQFNNPNNIKFLGGFFVTMQTEVRDVVGYASQVLKGKDVKDLPISYSKPEYIIDYNAMQMVPEYKDKYNEWKDRYHIINVPFHLRHHTLFILLCIGGVLLFIAIVALIAYLGAQWANKAKREMLEKLETENRLRKQLLLNYSSGVWRAHNGKVHLPYDLAESLGIPETLSKEDLGKYIAPDYFSTLSRLELEEANIGLHRVRIKVTFDGRKSWHWYELVFNMTQQSIKKRDLNGLAINIDDIVENEKELTVAQRQASEVELKESFLANISHDLRTPLGAVTGFTQLLISDDIPTSATERKEYNEIIKQNSEMMLKMIDNIIINSQIEVGSIKLKQLPVDVSKLIIDCYNTNNILTPAHLSLNKVLDTPAKTIEIDIHSTKQVVNNFISNAFKFTHNGSVTIGWKYLKEDDQVEVYVEDTGIGISEENKNKLFDRYYKVDEQDKGTGLGLSLCQTIIEKQGGTIGVTSTLGVGSRFYFRMPAYRKEENA